MCVRVTPFLATSALGTCVYGSMHAIAVTVVTAVSLTLEVG